ncbi:uncharacterized protein DS421_13g398640 [Arachis hypogaea]|nr:uncharacterized protein DS421_13g398640 [Arachis hypogaea]
MSGTPRQPHCRRPMENTDSQRWLLVLCSSGKRPRIRLRFLGRSPSHLHVHKNESGRCILRPPEELLLPFNHAVANPSHDSGDIRESETTLAAEINGGGRRRD